MLHQPCFAIKQYTLEIVSPYRAHTPWPYMCLSDRVDPCNQ